MEPTWEIKADPVCLLTSPAKYQPAMVLHPLGSLVEECVFGIVHQAVADDEIEVLLKLIQAPVLVLINASPHGGEVHWVLNVLQIIWNLQEMLMFNLLAHRKDQHMPAHTHTHRALHAPIDPYTHTQSPTPILTQCEAVNTHLFSADRLGKDVVLVLLL